MTEVNKVYTCRATDKVIMIGKRGSGKTRNCFKMVKKTGGVFLSFLPYSIARAQYDKVCKEIGIDKNCRIVDTTMKLNGIRNLVIDEMDVVLHKMLSQYCGFSGKIVYGTITEGDGTVVTRDGIKDPTPNCVCGGKHHIRSTIEGWSVVCDNCSIRTACYETEDEAVGSWTYCMGSKK